VVRESKALSSSRKTAGLSNDSEPIESRARGASEVFSEPFSAVSVLTKQYLFDPAKD